LAQVFRATRKIDGRPGKGGNFATDKPAAWRTRTQVTSCPMVEDLQVASPRSQHHANQGNGAVLVPHGSYEDRMAQLRVHMARVQKRMKSLEDRRRQQDHWKAAQWEQHTTQLKDHRQAEVKTRLEELAKRQERAMMRERSRLNTSGGDDLDSSQDFDFTGSLPLDELCTADGIMQIADQHSVNGRLTVNEMQTFLQNTRYEGFMRWITTHKNWNLHDKNRSGTIELEELADAMQRYKDEFTAVVMQKTEAGFQDHAKNNEERGKSTGGGQQDRAKSPAEPAVEVVEPAQVSQAGANHRRKRPAKDAGAQEKEGRSAPQKSLMQEAQERFVGLYRSPAGRDILNGACKSQRSYRHALARGDPAAIARAEADTPTQELEEHEEEASSIAPQTPAYHRSIARRYRLRMMHNLCREVSACKRQLAPGAVILPPLSSRGTGDISSPLVAPLPKAMVSA